MIGEILRDNFRDIAILGGGIAAYVGLTGAQLPSDISVPDWWPLLVVAALLGGIGIVFASGKIDDLLPEDHGIYLQVVNAQRDDRIETWELSEDQWQDLEIVDGQLNDLTECKYRAYECLAYNPETNVAVATWRRSVPASQIVGQTDVADAIDLIHELREYLEPEAKRGRYLRQNLPGIVRRIDRERARNQARAIEPHVAPSFGGESINDAVDNALPDDLKPTRMANAEDVEQVADQDGGVSFDILDEEPDAEPLLETGDTNDQQ